ncbi:MAG: low molecular weight phosphotyrosine protein phosphatase [Rhodospirillales bacterium]|nr:low molecular weight phosphotyrosine protein phosphatase [Rhodospirillales bacterium]
MIIANALSPRGNPLIKVLFVCLGNICRSPTAEGVFRQLLKDQGLAKAIAVDSAGTSNWHVGGPPDARSQAIAKARGIDLSGLAARQAVAADFDEFDYVIAMDQANYTALAAICPPGREQRLHMCLAFAPAVALTDVPDPYYNDGFDRVFDMLAEAAGGLLAAIQKTHNL